MNEYERMEWARIAFVSDRDGVEVAHAFAAQGLGQYESAIREAETGGNQYGAVYGESLRASLRVYRQYLTQTESSQGGVGAQ